MLLYQASKTRSLCLLFFFPILLALLPACSGRDKTVEAAAEEQTVENDQAGQEQALDDPRQNAMQAAAQQAAAQQVAAQQAAAQKIAAQKIAAQIAAALDDRQLAAQVIISGIDGKGRLPPHMKALLAESPAGGIMMFKYNLDTDNGAIHSLIAETAGLIAAESGIPPFVAIDHEGGSVNRFLPGVADLPSAADYGEMAQGSRESAISQIIFDSFNAGKALRALGINLNLAPVAEFLNDDNREFLINRSYGPDPVFTAEAAAAFITGMEAAGVLCVAKHFPGSAGADPHHYPSVLNGGKAALGELVSPIAALIRNGRTRAIMVSHSAVPAMDTRIASLSPLIMNEWLRRELGFNGIIVCDDFSMVSANQLKPETAAVLSLAAGADMVLVWPPDLLRTHRAIMAALANGELPRERLQEAAGKIIFEKLKMGLIGNEE